MNGKTFNVIKIILIHFIGCVLCALQAYISMYEYKDSISSACIRCSYNKDVLIGSIFFYLFFVFAYLLFFFFTHLLSKAENIKKIYKIILITVIYVATYLLEIDIFFYLFFFFIYIFSIFCLIKNKNIKKIYKIIPIMIIYVAACFTVNNVIFTDKVTSWSTFTANEELAGVISRSFSQILVTAFIFYYLISRLLIYYGENK